jgi:chromosome segregation ATPase
MARPGVTYTEVAEAANQLLGLGKNPTIEQIRHLLGTGSSTTLANHLRQWKNQQEKNQIVALKEDLPEDLVALMKGLWQRVVAEAEGKIAENVTLHQRQLDELVPELKKYKTNNQRWQQLYNQWSIEKKQLSQDLELSVKKRQQLEKDYATLSEKQEAALQQLEEKQIRIKELHKLHQQTQTNWEHFRESVRTQRLHEQQRHDTQKQELQTQIKELKAQQAQLKNEAQKTEKQYQRLQKSHELLEERSKDFKNENEALTKKIIGLETETRVLAKQLSESQETLTETLQHNKQLGQEKWLVVKEKSQLEGQLKQLQQFMKLREA